MCCTKQFYVKKSDKKVKLNDDEDSGSNETLKKASNDKKHKTHKESIMKETTFTTEDEIQKKPRKLLKNKQKPKMVKKFMRKK